MREYAGLSKPDFGKLFQSSEHSVYEWETGICMPRLIKLVNIAVYFDVSLDCLIYGKATANSRLERTLCALAETSRNAISHLGSQLFIKINSLPDHCKERLTGYLDALCRDNTLNIQ